MEQRYGGQLRIVG